MRIGQWVSALCSISAFLLASCTLEETNGFAMPSETEVLDVNERGSAEDLYFDFIKYHSAGLISDERLDNLLRRLAVVDESYSQAPDYEETQRVVILMHFRLAVAELRREDRLRLEGEGGRAYARKLSRTGVEAAETGAEATIVIAGMLGMPTSKEDALLMVALSGGGYLVVKIGGKALKRAAFLLRGSQNADEVVEASAKLGFQVQKVDDIDALRTVVASEDAALAAQFEEIADRIPRTDMGDIVDPGSLPVASVSSAEARRLASSSASKYGLLSVESWRKPQFTADGLILPFKDTRTPANPIRNMGRQRAGQTITKGKTTIRFDTDGFPVFEPRFETLIEDSLIGNGRKTTHFKSANEKLFSAIKEDPTMATQIGLTPEEVRALATSSASPPRHRWHHHQDVGRMQLVNVEEHELADGHTGGMAIWGGGYQR